MNTWKTLILINYSFEIFTVVVILTPIYNHFKNWKHHKTSS